MLDHKYVLKWGQETVWAALLAAVAVAGPMLLALDWEQVGVWGVEDWRTWGLAVALSVGRVVVAVVGNRIRLVGKGA